MKVTVPIHLLLAALIGLSACKKTPPPLTPEYQAEIDTWHKERTERLKADEGWLTLAGLYWLKQGSNRVGAAKEAEVTLPQGSAPAAVGVIQLEGEAMRFEPAPELIITANGAPLFGPTALKSDANGDPTTLRLGGLTFYVLARQGRLGVRLKDNDSPVREGFGGIERFPLNTAWRVEARLEAAPEGHTIQVPSAIGGENQQRSPGQLVFEWDGDEQRLHAQQGAPGEELFLVFADATSGMSTYGGGRFLYAPAPSAGKVMLDFNKAYNPPCAFTPYATCPLPPKGNRLEVPVEAGERSYGNH